jgi:peptidoglycan hydrolase-like protein with peptidoglycan-binding domain
MPGDEALNLTPEQTAAIAVCSDNYFAAVAKSDTAGMQLAHDTADEIRAQAGKTQQTGTNQPPSSYANLQNAAAYYYVPTPYEIVVGAITATSKDVMSKEQILKTASEWLAYSSSLREFGSGASGTVVNQLQTRLNTLGYTDGNGRKLDVDGSFGANTANALAKFNSERGLSSSRVNLTTWTALGLSPADYLNLTPKENASGNTQEGNFASAQGTIERMLEIAAGELGTAEYNDASMTIVGTGNYTKYGAWNAKYGNTVGNPNPWCVMFMNYCAAAAGVSTDVIPWNYTASSTTLADWYSKNGRLGDVAVYTPKAGDLWITNAHTAIVVADVIDVDGKSGTTYTIDGNSSDTVRYNKRSYNIDESGMRTYRATNILGFAINYGTSSGSVPAIS